MDTFVINFYPIAKFIIVLFVIVGFFSFLNNLANVLGRFGKGKLDNKKDMHAKDCDADIIQDLIQKYPAVEKEFVLKTEIEQNIENNQEIHEINKKIDLLQKDMDEVRRIQRGGL